MLNTLRFASPSVDGKGARIGGGALIGDIMQWPTAPDGVPLTLIMSLPACFLKKYVGLDLRDNYAISVFSYNVKDEYFLDCITYHGISDELDILKKGYTRVVLHKQGAEVNGPSNIASVRIDVDNGDLDSPEEGSMSKIAGEASLLQAQPLQLGNEIFILQVYAGSLPKPDRGIFGLSDAVGYLFIDPTKVTNDAPSDVGTFFVQVT